MERASSTQLIGLKSTMNLFPKLQSQPVKSRPQHLKSSELGSIFDDNIGGNVFFIKLKENNEREIQSE